MESRKGDASIRVYGLQRNGLREVRRDRWLDIQGEMQLVQEGVEDAEAYNGDPRFKERLRTRLTYLRRQRDADRPYAGMARQMIDPFIEELRPRLVALLGKLVTGPYVDGRPGGGR
jgi:hypothetical protein